MDLEWGVVAAGLLVGFMVGLTGMGGGALMTPILVLVFGVDPSTAVGTDLVVSLLMKPVGGGVHLRRGTVQTDLVRWLVLGSMPAAFCSVWLVQTHLDPERVDVLVKNLIGAALLVASATLAVKGAFAHRTGTVVDEDHPVHVHRVRTVAIGVFGGVMVGLTSVGSGSLMMVLLLLLYPVLSARQLVGTDLVQAVPLVAAAALGHLLFGSVELGLTAGLLLGALPGVWFGAHVSSRAPDYAIRPLLAVVLVGSGLKMLGASNTGSIGVSLALCVAAIVVIVRGRAEQVRPAVEQGP
ncbi:MAG: sulfite exporter TauE/SafE family protein [Acidimicrobiales bacterium]|nr:sulfite exporter TauE/SafE family protein [Acidimicrobiales bacterium]